MRYQLVRLLLIVCCLLPLAASAQAPREPANYFIYRTIPVTTSCNGFPTHIIFGSDGGDEYIGTLIKANGAYMDENTGGFFGSSGETTWGFFSINDRGLQNREFPLPANTPFNAETTMFAADYTPLWRSKATFSRCNNGAISKVTNYEPQAFHDNGSFELTFPIGIQPLGWQPSPAIEGTESGVDCMIAKVEACSLRIEPDSDANKQVYTQVYSNGMGIAGKRIELAAFQYLGADFAAYGTVTATLKFKNGETAVLELNTDRNAGSEEWKYGIKAVALPSPLVKATIRIKLKGKQGGAWRIDGLSLAVYDKSNFVPVVRASPLALPPAAN